MAERWIAADLRPGDALPRRGCALETAVREQLDVRLHGVEPHRRAGRGSPGCADDDVPGWVGFGRHGGELEPLPAVAAAHVCAHFHRPDGAGEILQLQGDRAAAPVVGHVHPRGHKVLNGLQTHLLVAEVEVGARQVRQARRGPAEARSRPVDGQLGTPGNRLPCRASGLEAPVGHDRARDVARAARDDGRRARDEIARERRVAERGEAARDREQGDGDGCDEGRPRPVGRAQHQRDDDRDERAEPEPPRVAGHDVDPEEGIDRPERDPRGRAQEI